MASVNYPNSQVTNYSWYNNLGDQRLQQINNLSPSSTILSQFNYQYDAAGEITQWNQQAGSNPPLQYGLGYDLAGQLTSAHATLGNSSGPTATNYNYGYDAASNRTAVQQSIVQTIALSGTITPGNTLTITVCVASRLLPVDDRLNCRLTCANIHFSAPSCEPPRWQIASAF